MFGVVGEHNHEGAFLGAGYLVGEASAGEADGVDAVDDAVGAINVQLCLVHLKEMSFETKMALGGAAGEEESDE